MGRPQPLFNFIFVFPTTQLQFLQQQVFEKCPSSIQYWDLNSRPLEHESLPITTRPVLPQFKACFGGNLIGTTPGSIPATEEFFCQKIEGETKEKDDKTKEGNIKSNDIIYFCQKCFRTVLNILGGVPRYLSLVFHQISRLLNKKGGAIDKDNRVMKQQYTTLLSFYGRRVV